MSDIPRASLKQLSHKIKGFGKHPRLAFFLGAGASRQSGILTASEMTRVFKDRIFAECCPEGIKSDDKKEQWLREQPWYKTAGSEYSKLFTQFEPKEIGRQRYIESIVEGQEPSFGYVVLANLIANNYVNTVITTNFDDLVYSACTGYTGIRPIVYAYGILASEMRITSARPKILKLHGDFLYSALKNTDVELEAQDQNMSRQVIQVLSEYGLVVVGYSGSDESVMRVLSDISEKNDLYWCIKSGDELNTAVKKLLRDKRGFIVEIEGFDEMMTEARKIVGFEVSKMFESMQERQDQIIERLKSFASSYSIDILSEVVEALQQQAKQASEGQEQIKKIQALDLFARARKATQDQDWSLSERLYREVLKLTPDDVKAMANLAVIVGQKGKYKQAERLLRNAIELQNNYSWAYISLGWILFEAGKPEQEVEVVLRRAYELNPNHPTNINNLVMVLRLTGRYQEAMDFVERGLEIEPKNKGLHLSRAAIHKALGHKVKSRALAQQAKKLVDPDDWYNLACVESILGNTEEAIKNLLKSNEENKLNVNWALRDPDLATIRNDKRFKAMISKKKTSRTSVKSRE